MDFITTTLIIRYFKPKSNTATHLRVKLPRFKLFTISYLYASFGQYIGHKLQNLEIWSFFLFVCLFMLFFLYIIVQMVI